jgi:hypothetical protein
MSLRSLWTNVAYTYNKRGFTIKYISFPSRIHGIVRIYVGFGSIIFDSVLSEQCIRAKTTVLIEKDRNDTKALKGWKLIKV